MKGAAVDGLQNVVGGHVTQVVEGQDGTTLSHPGVTVDVLDVAGDPDNRTAHGIPLSDNQIRGG